MADKTERKETEAEKALKKEVGELKKELAKLQVENERLKKEPKKQKKLEDRTVVLNGKQYDVVGEPDTVAGLLESFKKQFVEETRIVVLLDTHHGI